MINSVRKASRGEFQTRILVKWIARYPYLTAPFSSKSSFSGVSKGYAFHGDSYRVFHEFFGGDNPFSDFFHLEKNLDVDGHATFGGLQGRAQPKQDPPVERELFLTLEELYKGCTKKMKISRKVRDVLEFQMIAVFDTSKIL